MSDLAFSHLDPLGRARMVDVTPKDPTHRRAVARCKVFMSLTPSVGQPTRTRSARNESSSALGERPIAIGRDLDQDGSDADRVAARIRPDLVDDDAGEFAGLGVAQRHLEVACTIMSGDPPLGISHVATTVSVFGSITLTDPSYGFDFRRTSCSGRS